jgi:hypothetical protein
MKYIQFTEVSRTLFFNLGAESPRPDPLCQGMAFLKKKGRG